MTGLAWAVTGVIGVVGAVNAGLILGSSAAADSGWASNNVYCYQDAGATSATRYFIREVHVYATDNGTKMDFTRERQSWNGNAYVEDSGEPLTVDVTELGGLGVLNAFESGGDPDWVCRNWAGKGYEHGRLATET